MGAGHLLGAQHQDLLEHLVPDLVDHGLDYLTGILDQVDDGKQDLSVGLAELLDYGGRLARSAGHDVVSFLHGGRLLSVILRLATGFYRIGATAAYPPSTKLGTPSGAGPIVYDAVATDGIKMCADDDFPGALSGSGQPADHIRLLRATYLLFTK
jgi:hypothetical protein